MGTHKKLTIGLFGYGVVGEALYRVLNQTPSLNASIKKICIRDEHKARNAPASLFTINRNDLLEDDEINVIVEVINDTRAALEIVTTAMMSGKDVVSASKKMIAENMALLLQLQKESGCSFLYEAAACASIPVIRNLEEYYDNDLLHSFKGIVNGSTNFILTKIFEERLDLKHAVLQAKQSGFAESDPRLDVEGFDAMNKLCLLLTHAYGIIAHPDDLFFTGIQHIQPGDALVGQAKDQQIKLVAQARKLRSGKVSAFVLPQFVVAGDHLAFVKDEYNGLVIESGFADKQFFYGKGAGGLPTASAILSDISALRYNYKYEYKKLYHHTPHELSEDVFLRVYISFDRLEHIFRECFEWIEEWHLHENRKWLVGVIALTNLETSDWWRSNNVSLILTPDPVIEDISLRQIRKKSLELAGIV